MDKKLDNKKWYMITTISGKEEKVIESLKNRVVSEGMENDYEVGSDVQGFKAMMVPFISQKELEKKLAGGDYKIKSRNLFPGYIFIKMKFLTFLSMIITNVTQGMKLAIWISKKILMDGFFIPNQIGWV